MPLARLASARIKGTGRTLNPELENPEDPMKKHLLAATALAGLLAAPTAFAADLPARTYTPPPAPVAAVPIFTWTGFYIGLNAGYGWNVNDSAVTVPGVGLVDVTGDDGFVGGGQVGYNYQIGSFVLGLEADLQYADLGNERDVTFGDSFVAGGGLDWFGTVRARAGYAFDRALLYATGGFAFGGGSGGNCLANGIPFTCGDDTSTGWTLGGGLEYAVTNNFTVKLEGLYVNLDRGGDDAPFDTGVLLNRDDYEFGVVRAGLNYKF
jgi:outer membrane immunogenic protein